MPEFPYVAKKRVIQLGSGSLAVLLPAAWARENQVKKGSDVIVFANGQVIIEPATPERIQQARAAIKKLQQPNVG